MLISQTRCANQKNANTGMTLGEAFEVTELTHFDRDNIIAIYSTNKHQDYLNIFFFDCLRLLYSTEYLLYIYK